MARRNSINSRIVVLEEHMETINKEMGNLAITTKEIKTALIGDLSKPDTMDNSIDKRLSKMEQRYKITIAVIVVILPIMMWVLNKFL